MAKRFHDTDLWDKEWFMALKPKHKCLVQFIFSKCDQSGVWSPNWILASSFIGEKVAVADLSKLAKHFEVMPNGKIFVLDFVPFQYGELTDKCPPHRKIIALLKSHGLFERVTKGYQYPTDRVQEKEEEKDKDKDEETEEEKDAPDDFSTPAAATKKKPLILFSQSNIFDKKVFADLLFGTQYESANIDYYHEVMNNWSDSGQNKKIEWLAAAKNWMAKDMKEGKFITYDYTPPKNGQANSKNGNNSGGLNADYKRKLAERMAAATGGSINGA